MLVSLKWLDTMVKVPDTLQDFCDRLDLTGTGVEGVETLGADLEGVRIGLVKTCEPHPDSDHMHVTTVDFGDGAEPTQIVCGAPNVRAGLKVAVATIGTVLPGDFKIKKSKLRGVESCGMICSERELNLGSDHDGIMELPDDAPLGESFAAWRGLSDTVLDLEITPNRPDCLSMKGFAREVGAMYHVPWHYDPPCDVPGPTNAEDVRDLVSVEIDDPELCPRYTARIIRDVKVGPSPQWLVERITALGARPINNVVDVTNYVMFLTGQPLHAFDLGKLTERDGCRHIVVRAAADGEKLETLDGVERTLTPDMAVITDDGKAPVALAGVMGGMNSEIDENTVDVLLESATFSSGHVSRTSRNLDLMSEASIRYERQVDGANCANVAEIAAALFEECCGAEVCPGIVDVYPVVVPAPVIDFRPARARMLCGAQIPDEFMVARLSRLGCSIERVDDEHLTVTAPTNRPDLTREVDLIEEVCRLWGEGDIEPTLPAARNHAGGLTVEQKRIRLIGQTLRACGLSETSTYCFADPNDLVSLGITEEGRGIPVKIINPLVADQSEMRRSMLPGLVRSVAYNLDHGVPNVALYEIGRVFFGHESKSQPDEPTYVCGVLAGKRADDAWNSKFPDYDFFDAKGAVEQLLSALRLTKVRFKVADAQRYPWLQPGRAAEVLSQGEVLGWVGNIHPASLQKVGVDVPVVAFELSVEALLRLAVRELPYVDVPTLPGVTHDLAIVVDESVSYEQLVQRIGSAGGKLLADVRLFDVYRDPVRVGKGKKSMAFSLTYRAADRTLTSEEVEKAHEKLVNKVLRATGGEVRS